MRLFKPMLLENADRPFDSPDFVFEFKLDGMRTVAYLENGKVKLINRNGNDVTSKFPELQNMACSNKISAVLDGEIASLENGKPSFIKLQNRILSSSELKIRRAAAASPVKFFAFDILYLNGTDLTDRPLLERKDTLYNVIKDSPYSETVKHIKQHGIKLFEAAKSENLEGIVAKRIGSRYSEGVRSTDWLKIKVFRDGDFVLLGYKTDPKNSKITGLHLEGIGFMGFNLSALTSNFIKKSAATFITKTDPDGTFGLEPRLCVTLTYLNKTDTGSLRHPVFKEIKTL